MCHIFVTSIDCQGILNEVVCTYTEKIHFLGKDIRQKYSRRDLYHNACFDILIKWNSFSPQLILGLLQVFLDLNYF